MDKIGRAFLAALVCVGAHADTNEQKLTELTTFQAKELKALMSKGGNLKKAATDLDIEISNAAKFCGGSHKQVQSCTVLLDKALNKKTGIQKTLAATKNAEMQSVTGGAASAKGVAGRSWQKGHTSSGPQLSAAPVGVPRFKTKQAPIMGKKPAPPAKQ